MKIEIKYIVLYQMTEKTMERRVMPSVGGGLETQNFWWAADGSINWSSQPGECMEPVRQMKHRYTLWGIQLPIQGIQTPKKCDVSLDHIQYVYEDVMAVAEIGSDLCVGMRTGKMSWIHTLDEGDRHYVQPREILKIVLLRKNKKQIVTLCKTI